MKKAKARRPGRTTKKSRTFNIRLSTQEMEFIEWTRLALGGVTKAKVIRMSLAALSEKMDKAPRLGSL